MPIKGRHFAAAFNPDGPPGYVGRRAPAGVVHFLKLAANS